MKLEPITRIEGHLGVDVKVDGNVYSDANVEITMFRGFEILLKNKKIDLAPNLTEKICGVCGATHALVSIETLEMAKGVYPSEGYIDLRNMAYALADIMYNNVVVAFMFEAIDFSTNVTSRHSPSLLDRAKETYCTYKDHHGYTKMVDLMQQLYFSGDVYKTALKVQTKIRDLATLIWLRYPQPVSLKAGGLEVRDQNADQKIKEGIKELRPELEKLFYVAKELRDFFQGMYKNIGEDFVTYGLFESHDYDATYENMGSWASKRVIPPALIKGGEIVTRDLRSILLGVRIDVDGTPYEKWEKTVEKDPLGNEVDERHPWNKETKLKVSGRNYLFTVRQSLGKEEYLPTTGDIARLYTYRKVKGKPRAFGEEWEYRSNDVIERFFARVFTVYFLADFLLNYEVIKKFNSNSTGKVNEMAVGAHDAPRGGNAHWMISKQGTIQRYQIVTPTDRNFSKGGPVERSIVGQRVTEENGVTGLDVLRIVRSFDPCSACAVHVYNSSGEKIVSINAVP
ncbi:nickel-dependent hydrogenase large subunit [Stygiolobus caldivivus]|uniref:Hydrogenase n=1 Tax=Stygiolobus caldivivus TaxID=2824673 RepID=A0A8D5U3N7_9CREN|nr:nickel-dependent hydrogenase large subunit [Stygiolobus caldivivus]BCU68830.1 hydrogenase [Stygiolobus caldivivus]